MRSLAVANPTPRAVFTVLQARLHPISTKGRSKREREHLFGRSSYAIRTRGLKGFAKL
jgi:hypothetical protein